MSKNKTPNEIINVPDEYLNEMKNLGNLLLSCQDALMKATMNIKNDISISYLSISSISVFLRKAIEILIFSTLITDKEKYKQEKESSNWRIKNVIDAIEKINPDWFPVPIEIIVCDWSAKDIRCFQEKEIKLNPQQKQKDIWKKKENTINKNHLIEYYNYLSKFLHSENKLKDYKHKWDNEDFILMTLANLAEIRAHIMNLINTFTIQLLDNKYLYYVNISTNGVYANIFEKKFFSKLDE